MNASDQAHIELLARRHSIRILSPDEALMMVLGAWGFKGAYELVNYAQSFSASNPETGENVMFVGNGDKTPEERYFVGLHETAHVVLGHRNSQEDKETVTENEIAAWEWAFAHANYWPSDKTILMMIDSLSTYTDDLYDVHQKKD